MLTLGLSSRPPAAMRARQKSERLKKARGLFVVLASLTMCLTGPLPAIAQEKPLRVLATGVFATTLRSLTPAFETAMDYKLQVTIANAGQVAARLAAGEPADIVMTSSASTKTLTKQGCTASAPMRQNWGGELGRVLVSSQ